MRASASTSPAHFNHFVRILVYSVPFVSPLGRAWRRQGPDTNCWRLPATLPQGTPVPASLGQPLPPLVRAGNGGGNPRAAHGDLLYAGEARPDLRRARARRVFEPVEQLLLDRDPL